MLGKTLVTKQTGEPGGGSPRLCRGRLRHRADLYLSCWWTGKPPRASWSDAEGGVEIEEVAGTTREDHPGRVDPASGMSGFHARKAGLRARLEGKQVSAFASSFGAVPAFTTRLRDREINPVW
jgi:succinyl-CoA synthetase beta subunit